jgi:Do/DeqQ family serine protease
MPTLRFPLLAVLAATLIATAPPAAAQLPAAVEGQPLPTLAPMLEQVTPAVVNIQTRGRIQMENPLLLDPFFRRFFDLPEMPRERPTQNVGSGVIVDAEQGYIITNNHVIERADEIVVTLRDGRRAEAELVGRDPETDVALLRIPAEDLVALPLADSDDLRVGDFVLAIGNPFGLGQTVTSGIVSALGRTGLAAEGFQDFIQTDASINPGNSGGPLVNLRGEVVGINTAILAPTGGNIGIGFAIPSNMASGVMRQLVEFGEVRRGRLGVAIQDLTPELAQALGIGVRRGVVIAQVVPGSPAEQAGLREGDVVTRVNRRAVQNAAELRNVIGLLRIGDQVTLEVIRNGEQMRVQAVIAEREVAAVPAGPLTPRLAGATFGPIAPDSPLHGRVEGVQALAVEPGSPASQSGLRPDDVVVSVNRQPVASMEQFQQAVSAAEGPLLLNVRRGEGALFILIR